MCSSIPRRPARWAHLSRLPLLQLDLPIRSFLSALSTIIALTAPFTARANAYDVVPVQNGGQLTIQVVHAGKPVVVTEAVDRDQTFCGTEIKEQTVKLGSAGQLADAVVYLADIARGKAPDTTAVARLDNRGCQFVPRIQAVTVGQTIQIVNSDPILHSTHAKDGNRTVFNLALPTEGQTIPKKIRAPGLMHVRCDAGHTWMNAWIDAFPHPYHAVTDQDGQATLTAIPPGTYQVAVWHETLGKEAKTVTIKAGETASVRFDHLTAAPDTTTPQGTSR